MLDHTARQLSFGRQAEPASTGEQLLSVHGLSPRQYGGYQVGYGRWSENSDVHSLARQLDDDWRLHPHYTSPASPHSHLSHGNEEGDND